jgi:hypothetical protein
VIGRQFRLILMALVLAAACVPENPVALDQHPSWLTSLIRQLETEPGANPPAFIARYEYKGQVVYYVPPRCCDVSSALHRTDGTVLCQPDGGFAGTGDGRCADFTAERKNEQIVWRDPRRGP